MFDTARLTTATAAKTFILGGNAVFTLVSTKTSTRFTYNVRAGAAEPPDVWFVSLLTGPDNENDYRYLGRIDSRMRFWAGRKTPKAGDVGVDAPSMKAFAWTWQGLSVDLLDSRLEIWHEGRCARCNRRLTVPASIASGFGPECAGKAGITAMREDFGA